MQYQGKAISIDDLGEGLTKLVFDLKGESVNKLNQITLSEMAEAVAQIKADTSIKGLLITSAKDVFIVGADITEFGEMAQQTEPDLVEHIYSINQIFNALEDLNIPTVAAINGLALGGGMEVCLAADYRVMAQTAKVGFPEVKLGIVPGYGGTVRTPRLVGADNAVEWIATGREFKASAALTVGIVDAVVELEALEAAGLDLLNKAIAGDFDFQARKAQKKAPLQLDDIEMLMAFVTAKAMVSQQAGRHMPAPLTAVKTMEKHAKCHRDEALKIEATAVAKLAKSEVAKNLVSLFLGDQELTKTAKNFALESLPVKKAAVLGAGIMGGGIAYQSAVTGTPIIMKDIEQKGIDTGVLEAGKLLSAQVNRKRMTPEVMAATLANIEPTLSYETIASADLIVEAVVENPAVKKAVLSEIESLVDDNVIITSNTSTIPISVLASSLKRPENFCGMHFFNPVHKMPLVEVIRGEKTSEAAVAKTVNYALAMGKKPVVVNDCPGFLVNRILFGYFSGFIQLLHDGADYLLVDKVAEKFGWPMGPAYLGDVVGIDTGLHAGQVMAKNFPDRMAHNFKTAMEVMFENNRLGQKNGVGFYRYVVDKKGRPQKVIDEHTRELLSNHVAPAKEFSEEEILDRLMIPFCLESVRCLEEGIADCATDLDMALIFGIGFPVFRGGALRHIDNIGLQAFCDTAERYSQLGEFYQPTKKLKLMAANGETIY